MADRLKQFPVKSGVEVGSSKVAKFCNGEIWRITSSDAKALGLKDLAALKWCISARASRYGRGIKTRTGKGFVIIQVLSAEATAARSAKHKAGVALRDYLKLNDAAAKVSYIAPE